MKILAIGGGAIGTSIAWHLAERGFSEVVLLEQDRLGSGTTWHSAGNITWRPLPDQDASVLYPFEVIDRLERDGLFVATAMNSAGITWSAMTGHLVSDLVAGKESRFDASRYDPKRFADRGRDLAWLTQAISGIVSAGYRKHNE